MKKTLITLFTLILVLMTVLCCVTGCGDEPVPQETTVTVIFKDGDTQVKTASTVKDTALKTADLPTDPTKAGYTFLGWYNGETKFDATAAVTADATFTAKWEQITHSVTFKNGETVVKTATVADGAVIAAADIPADLSMTGNTFLGWYNGETEFDAAATVSADVTYAAKWEQITYSVTFKIGETPVKSAVVNHGAAPAEEDLPDQPTKDGYKFLGWYNGETMFDEEAAVTASVTYTAKWEKNAFFVTYANGIDAVVKYVDYVTEGNAILGTTIPAAPAGTGIFLGWYSNGTMAESTTVVTGDVTYTAIFVSQASYTGAWINTTDKEMLFFATESDNFVAHYQKLTMRVAYNAETGAMTYSEGTYSSKKTWTILAIGNQMTVGCYHYDDIEEIWVTDTVTLTQCETVAFSGDYRRDKSTTITVFDGGVMNLGSSVYYAVMYASNDAYKIDVKTSATGTVTTYDATIDADGNIIVGNDQASTYRGIYIKGATAMTEYYCSANSNTLDAFTVGANTVYTFKKSGNYYKATVAGTVADGETISVTYNDTTDTVKVSGTNITYAGAERGTYTNNTDTLVLDGFGKATLNSNAAVTYTYIATSDHVTLDGATYTLDLTEKTYTAATPVGTAGTFICDNDKKYTLTLNGYGDAILVYKSTYSTTYSYGTYTVGENTLTVAGTSYSYNGTYSVEESGNVLVLAKNGYTLIKEGYTVTSHKADYDGDWTNGTDTVKIDSEAGTVTLNNVNAQYVKFNYNGTVLTFTANFTCPNDFYSNNGPRDYTLTIVAGKLQLAHQCITGYDDIYEEYTYETENATLDKVIFDKTGFDGTWTWTYTDFSGASADGVIVIDSANNTVIYNGAAATNVVFNGSTLTFDAKDLCDEWPANARPHTVTIVDGKLVIKHDCGHSDEYGESVEFTDKSSTATKQVLLDAFAGTWKKDTNTLVFDGQGKVSYNGSAEVAYEVVGNVATFTVAQYEFTATLSGNTISAYMDDGDYPLTWTFTKQAETLDAFAGTWGSGSNTLVMDGKGSATYNGGTAMTYTISGTEATFDNGDYYFTVTIKTETTVGFEMTDGYDPLYTTTMTKQA